MSYDAPQRPNRSSHREYNGAWFVLTEIWTTVRGCTVSVFNQLPRPTQPGHSSGSMDDGHDQRRIFLIHGSGHDQSQRRNGEICETTSPISQD